MSLRISLTLHFRSPDAQVAFEQQMRAHAPSWMAYDLALNMGRFQQHGMLASSGDIDRLTTLLGRPLRSYRNFAIQTAEQWRKA
jgi:hypothetical protein